jgi:hypothetical protein
VEDGLAWALFGWLTALLLFNGWRHFQPIDRWERWRLRRTGLHPRVFIELQRRRARSLGYPSGTIDWNSEPVDWRLFPLPPGAFEGNYHPEHVASSFRELEEARSQDAARGAISRLEHALGDPLLSIVFPAALPASQRLLQILADPAALPWARLAAAVVLITLLDEPHPDIHFAGPGDDTLPRTHEAIIRAVKESAPVLRELAAREGPSGLDEPTRDLVSQALRRAGAS